MLRYALCLCFCFACVAATAQQPPEFPGPVPQHQWLKQFVGKWDTHSESPAVADQPAMQCSGTMDSRMLGEFWVVNRMEGNVAGATMHGLQTIGYDPAKKKYVGTWVDSMMNHLWQYEGTVDEATKTLTLEAEGPNFMAAGEMTRFRDAYQITSPNEIVATSSMRDQNGQWVVFMTGKFTRQTD